MAMLEGEDELSLSLLNRATLAWVEHEYHRKVHSEIAMTPLDRYLNGKDVGRPCPDQTSLKHVFCTQVHRKQRRSDGTFSLEGKRFEIPSQYRHLATIHIRYARWDLSTASLVEPHTHTILTTLYPLDRSANSDKIRRSFAEKNNAVTDNAQTKIVGIAPLLKDLMAEFAATGLPPAYLPKGERHE